MRWTKSNSIVMVLLLALAATDGLADESLLVERWSPAQVEPREYTTALVVGITQDTETRKHLENKLVSHLRGRGIECTTSYSIVPDLSNPGETEAILDKLLERRVDAVITVRVIPRDALPPGGFIDYWNDDTRRELTARQYVERALAGADPDAKRYVVELGMWEMVVSRSRIWAAHTDVHKMKKLRKLSGQIIQDTIDGLELDRVF